LAPAVDHPTRTLEEFFLEVIEKARRQTVVHSGVAPTSGVADYLVQNDAAGTAEKNRNE
jgi:hypothetical protein